MMLLATAGTFIITLGMVSVSVLLIGLILLQKNRGSGLSGALGGVGGHSAFGTKTGDFLTWVTVGLVAVFLLLAIVGTYVFEPTTKASNTGPAVANQTPLPMPVTSAPAMPIKVDNSPGTVQPIITPMDGPPPGVKPFSAPAPATTQPSR
jgi:preprotein translocase subunit SecG